MQSTCDASRKVLTDAEKESLAREREEEEEGLVKCNNAAF